MNPKSPHRSLSLPGMLWFAVAITLGFSLALGAPPTAYAERAKQKASNDPRRQFVGKTIRNITVVVHDVFDSPDEFVYQVGNDLNFRTKESVVRRELLFAKGDAYDQFKIEESERILRAIGFLEKVTITPIADGDFVDLEVSVRDTWTLIPQFDVSSGAGQTNLAAGIGETDLGGYGKRLEGLYREKDDRRSFEAVYEDPRVMGGNTKLTMAIFDRNDGHRGILRYGSPFRTILQTESWSLNVDTGDTVGRLFESGEESYIYRARRDDWSMRYTVAHGDVAQVRRRFSFGYEYQNDRFSQADQDDYDNLNLDPGVVSNDPAKLADDRLYTGPVVAYETIVPDFISLDYIDRFERVQDYNLGDQFSADLTFAPTLLGSEENALLVNANNARGLRLNNRGFVRGEIGANSRFQEGQLDNTLLRAEVKYYQSFEPTYCRDLFVGRHTLAASFFIDYGLDLDRDRQFLLGGDNGLRGYDARTFSGDKRLALNLEDRIHFVDDLYELVSIGGAFFADVGGASSDPLGTLLADGLYADVGFGLRLAFPRSSGGRVARLDFAVPLRDGPDGSNQFEIRLVFAGGQLFDSSLRSESYGPERSNIEIGVDR